MPFPSIQTAFSGGEWSPELYGRVDVDKYRRSCSTLRNMFASYRGGAYSRPGTAFVGRCKQNGNAAPPRLIPFLFSVSQGYIIEAGDNYFRFIFQGDYITETPIAISGATNADPCAISVSGTPYNVGDWIFFANVGGMTQLNEQTFIVRSTSPGSFTLNDLDGNPLDARNFGVYTSGGTAARIYEISTPYIAADLPFLKFTQSADVMSFTHPDYPPFDLERVNNTDWDLTQTDFDETISPPGTVAAATTTSGTTQYQFVVTTVDSATGSESVASAVATVNSVDISTTAGTIIVTWTPVAGADHYNVYQAIPTISGASVPVGSQFGFIGRALGTSFANTNITPDFTQSPPTHQNPFAVSTVLSVNITSLRTGCDSTTTVTITSSSGTGFVGTPMLDPSGNLTAVIIDVGGENYTTHDTVHFGGAGSGGAATLTIGPSDGTFPGVVSYFQQRRYYAATLNEPDTYFASKPGDYTNFDVSDPTIDSDAITGTPWAQQVNGIQFIVPLAAGAVIFTGLGEWVLSGGTQNAVTPSNQIATPQSYNGCSPVVPPITINNFIHFVQSKGSIVRELQYNPFFNIIAGSNDTTINSSHLFEGHQILQWAYAEEPFKLIWAVREDGVLLCDTWLREQEVNGWSRHDTQGTFVSVAVVSEGVSQPSSGTPPAVSGVIAGLEFESDAESPECGLAIGEVTVKAVDSLGNPLTDFTGAITVALHDNPAGASLTGTLTVNAVAGVANFTDLAVSKAGAGFTLAFTTPELVTPLISSVFTAGDGAFAVCFDGNTLLSQSPLSIILSTASYGVINAWWRISNSGTLGPIFGGDHGANLQYTSVDYEIANFHLFDSGGNAIVTVDPGVSVTDTNWHQDIISWDTSTQRFQWMRDGVLLTPSVAWSSSAAVDYTLTSRFSFFGTLGGNLATAHASDFGFWVSHDFFFDLSLAGNVAKLRTLAGKPVDITGDPRVNGNLPLVFFHGDSTDYQTNLGTGTGFSVVGDPLTASGDSPW